MNKKSFEWWVGQAIAIYLGIAAIGSWNGTAGAIVTYVLFVLVDIREYAKVVAGTMATEGPNAEVRGASRLAGEASPRMQSWAAYDNRRKI